MKKLSVLFLVSIVISAQSTQIIIDENFDDWNNVTTFVEDNQENSSTGVDFKKLWITNDDNYLFIRIDCYSYYLIQEDTSTVLYINTDNNVQTGSPEYNSGAEIKYIFGYQNGFFFVNNDTLQMSYNDLKIISSPTVSSNTYEICIPLDNEIAGVPVFPDDEISVKFAIDPAGVDEIPNGSGLLEYTIDRNSGASYPEYSINKIVPSSFRLLAYNVHRDDIFNEETNGTFERLLNAINPDIIAFQEIYEHTAEETAALVEEFLPSDSDQEWYSAKAEQVGSLPVDVLIVSRYPVINTFKIKGYEFPEYDYYHFNSANLIDLPGIDKNLLLVVAHPPCCQNNYYREIELQEIMSFVRDAKTAGGDIDLDENTPIIIAGDMNLVSSSYQRDILTDGNILDNTLYGDDFNPDWDETAFADLKPYTTGYPTVFTWYDETNDFGPGRLDYIIYSDYTIEMNNSYALFTKKLPNETLQELGLEKDDVNNASDHLPVVADFTVKNFVSVKQSGSLIPDETGVSQNYPNPFNPSTLIKYSVAQQGVVKLSVYDLLGQKTEVLVNEIKSPGEYSVRFDASNLTAGIYFYQLAVDDLLFTRKMIYMK